MTRLHYAWLIVAAAFVTLTISNGLAIGGMSVFDETLLKEFGWSRGDLKMRELLTLLVAGITAPLAGAAADRHGVRPLIVVGALCLAGGLLGYGYATELRHTYVIHGLFGVALACAGLVVCVMLVSRWFHDRRGTAIGLALVGTSIGGMLFPKLNTYLLEQMPWREAFQTLALIPLLLVPLALLAVREWPRDRRLAAYGASESPDDEDMATGKTTGATSARNVPGLTFAEAIRTRDFWLLAVCAMCTFYVILGAVTSLFLHLRGLGFDPGAAASGISAVFFMAMLGKFAFGRLAEDVEPKKVFLGTVGCMLVGAVCLASMSESLYWPFVILFGFGWGGLYTMLQLLAVSRFGLKETGRILGAITFLDALGGALGPWVTNVIFDQTGSYRLAFAVMVGLLSVALVLGALFRASPAARPMRVPATEAG